MKITTGLSRRSKIGSVFLAAVLSFAAWAASAQQSRDWQLCNASDEDEVSLSSETPNLEAICAKFDKEHYHTLDEVRFVVEGEGIFDVRDKKDRWVRIFVEEGDLIIIPAKMYHRLSLIHI